MVIDVKGDEMTKNKLLKIVVPVVIVIIIIGIWCSKNWEDIEAYTSNSTDNTSEEGDTAESESSADEVDTEESANSGDEEIDKFALDVTEVDVDTWLTYGLPIIIDFGSDECIPCVEMYPVLETMNEEMQEKAIIKFIDVWKYSSEIGDFPIQVIPTQIFMNTDGTPYVPSEDIGIDFIQYYSNVTDEHVYTAHQGGLTEDEMRAILADMGVE